MVKRYSFVFILLTSACLAGATRADAQTPATAPRVSFELDIVPVLTRLGCNSGACHGKARGQNGFALSLLGFYPDFDYAALTQEARGRRVAPNAPESSLLLKKGAGLVPHGGGKRLELNGPYYQLLLQWIADGLPRKRPGDPTLVSIAIVPSSAMVDTPPATSVLKYNEQQALRVVARFSDNSTRDVTALSSFQSNESAIVAVDPNGVIKAGMIPGEAAIMARYLGKITTHSIVIPLPGNVPADFYASLPKLNLIDGLVWDKLRSLSLTPSAPASDATWFRRVYLDIIGRVPTPDEIRPFLADQSPDKRTRVIDQLLERPEYAEFWANKWADLLRPNPYRVGIKAVLNYDAWIRDAFRKNKPYDQFVRELVTAQGSTWHNGAVTLFRDRREPDEITTIVSQLFLGIRLECAKCHHHPFENYGQEDFYAFAAYFSKMGRKGTGISPPISGSEEIFFTGTERPVTHPLTGDKVSPKPLYGTAPAVTEEADPRESLATWITSPENPYFARVIVNRVWSDIMGRGLVEPVDDLRATNPATNGPLLEALAAEFRKQNCDLKKLIRTIVSSYVYGLGSLPTDRNVVDTRNYSRHYRQRLRAEILLDAVCDVTEVPERFSGVAPGSRAMEIWTHRTDSLFLDSFGRPDANQDPPCERTGETTVIQALHLMNSPELYRKVTADEGRVARLAKSDKTSTQIVEELYLLVYARFPTDEELQVALKLFTEPNANRRQAIEDLLWALINTPEFVFKD